MVRWDPDVSVNPENFQPVDLSEVAHLKKIFQTKYTAALS